MATRVSIIQTRNEKRTATPGQEHAPPLARVFSATFLAFLAIVFLLGVNFVAVRFSNHELPPFWGAGLRFAVASLILLGIVRLRHLAMPTGAALVGAAVFGVLVFGAAYGFLYWALLYVSSGMAAVLFATVPLITLLLAVSVGLEQFRWRSAIGAVLALVGLGVVFREQLRADVPLISLLAVLLGALCAALSGIIIKRFPKSHPISTNAVAMAVGTLILLTTSRIIGEVWQVPALPATWAALGWLIISAIVAFVLMIWVLSRWSASATSYTSVLQPLVTVVVARWLVGEHVTLAFLIGGALALAGAYLGALAGQTRRPLAER